MRIDTAMTIPVEPIARAARTSLQLRLLPGGAGPTRARCPRCDTETLVEVPRATVHIDRCRRCGGIWLDPGELEVLLTSAQQGP